jgi:hypothetical protein
MSNKEERKVELKDALFRWLRAKEEVENSYERIIKTLKQIKSSESPFEFPTGIHIIKSDSEDFFILEIKEVDGEAVFSFKEASKRFLIKEESPLDPRD